MNFHTILDNLCDTTTFAKQHQDLSYSQCNDYSMEIHMLSDHANNPLIIVKLTTP